MTLAEIEAAWDLWFDLAQHTNDFDPPYTHGVFVNVQLEPLSSDSGRAALGGDGKPLPRE